MSARNPLQGPCSSSPVTAKFQSTRAFLDEPRKVEPYRNPITRVSDWNEINATSEAHTTFQHDTLPIQASRCMNCGTPFCQTHTGCPIANLIPEFNEMVYKQEPLEAYHRLSKTNNFPEFTGRVCPAPCEGACVAGLVAAPVTIKNIEYSIIERAFEEGWVVPRIPTSRTGRSVAVIGSGPAGLACADMLNQAGHSVTVYERADRLGGLLMYGIPNMKLEKKTVERRVKVLSEEGITFVVNVAVGHDDAQLDRMRQDYDALVLCTGSTVPRDLESVPGRYETTSGIHFAMEFLTKNQQRLLMTREGTLESGWQQQAVVAEGQRVIVIGGGDTGTDCIGTAMRHRCRSITNFELMPQPPLTRAPSNPWPQYPRIQGVDYGHAEVRAVFGTDPRSYNLLTTGFVHDASGALTGVRTSQVDRDVSTGVLTTREGTDKTWPCDLAILAMGFLHPETTLPDALSVVISPDGTIATGLTGLGLDPSTSSQNVPLSKDMTRYDTSVDGVFAAGDCRRGQSLVVWAIQEGRGVAAAVESYLGHEMRQEMHG